MMEVKIRRHKIHRPSRLKRLSALLWPIRWYLPTILLLALIPLAKRFPGAVELLYARSWYPAVAYTYGAFTSLFPFSLLEAGICLAAALTAFLLFHGLRRRRRGPYWRAFAKWLLRAASIAVSVFMLFCGYNYYRLPLAQICGFPVRDSSVQELYGLCRELAGEANALRAGLPEDSRGVTRLSQGIFPLCRQAKSVFSGLAGKYEALPPYPIKPKPVFFSQAMSMAQITGVFCPVTFEANINADAPAYSIPAAMCHELAHTRGFMREDEANFLGYLACVNSDSPEFRYSGVMLALIHAQNRLYAADYGLFSASYEILSEGVRRDFAYNNVYWARFEGPVGDVSTAVNDAYLRLNDQSDGVQSYGRMVDLLLAEYRQRHETADAMQIQ